MKIAFLVIDLQKAYRDERTKDSMDGACEYINAALPLFRRKGLPVVWVQHHDDDDGATPGQPGFELLDALVPEPTEFRITKRYGNSFNKTGLDAYLKSQGVDTVLIAGYCAEYCVLSTYRGALDLDYAPMLLKRAVASDDREHARMVEDISSVVSYGALKKFMEA